MGGHLKKANAPPLRHVSEFKVSSRGHTSVEVGQEIDVAQLFQEGELIDISGNSIGKGFQGGVKRWNMHRGLMTHGSKSHRAPGSIGGCHSGGGGRVLHGTSMPGRMGNRRVVVRKVQIIKIDKELKAIVVKGSVPGKIPASAWASVSWAPCRWAAAALA